MADPNFNVEYRLGDSDNNILRKLLNNFRNLVTGTTPISVSDTPSDLNAAARSAFGEALVGQLTPFVQALACYNLIPPTMQATTVSGGTATAVNGEFTVSTGTNAAGSATIRSFRAVNYKGGMGGVARFTARFSPGVPNSIQAAGLFGPGDSFLFGFQGADYGIIYQRYGRPEMRQVTVLSPSSGSTNLTLTLDSVAYTIPLTAGTVAFNAFQIATWLNANQTVWEAFQNDGAVVLSARTDGPRSGTYSYSHATSTGTVPQISAGVTKTTTFFPRASWNKSTADWIDTTKGNVHQIQYQYLGYGAIEFFVEDPSNGRFTLVHRIDYANLNTRPSVGNPSMFVGIFVENTGNTTNLTAGTASLGAFVQGTPGRTRNPRATSNVKSVGTPTFTALFSVRNRRLFQTEVNQVEIEPALLTAFTESARGATVRLVVGAALGGTPNWSYLNASSLVTEVDTAATTVTGGDVLAEFVIPANASSQIDLNALRIRLVPGQVITVAARVNSGAASDTGAAVVLYEDL